MHVKKYTMLLMGRRGGETDRAAELLAREGFVFTFLPVANYAEPRLEYRVASNQGGAVIGIGEIKDAMATVTEQLAALAA